MKGHLVGWSKRASAQQEQKDGVKLEDCSHCLPLACKRVCSTNGHRQTRPLTGLGWALFILGTGYLSACVLDPGKGQEDWTCSV